MQITMTTEYAVRTLLCLSAGNHSVPRRIGDVAAEAEVPESYLRKIIPILTKSGFVRSTVGATGGIQIALDPHEITLLDVFEAVEGKMALNKCLIHPHVCHRTPYCSVHPVWAEVQTHIREKLREKTMGELSQENTKNLAHMLQVNNAMLPTGIVGEAVRQ